MKPAHLVKFYFKKRVGGTEDRSVDEGACHKSCQLEFDLRTQMVEPKWREHSRLSCGHPSTQINEVILTSSSLLLSPRKPTPRVNVEGRDQDPKIAANLSH